MTAAESGEPDEAEERFAQVVEIGSPWQRGRRGSAVLTLAKCPRLVAIWQDPPSLANGSETTKGSCLGRRLGPRLRLISRSSRQREGIGSRAKTPCQQVLAVMPRSVRPSREWNPESLKAASMLNLLGTSRSVEASIAESGAEVGTGPRTSEPSPKEKSCSSDEEAANLAPNAVTEIRPVAEADRDSGRLTGHHGRRFFNWGRSDSELHRVL